MAHPNKTGESNTKMKQSLSQAQSAVEIFCGSATALPGVGAVDQRVSRGRCAGVLG
jgi:hypothetical protein